MKRFIFFCLIFSSWTLSAKVFDCFLFFNEFDLLDIRLAEMAPYVDQFVIVESVETFRGSEKPLYFKQNKKRYEKYQNQIIHVVIGKYRTKNVWDREAFQRNGILLGLKDCKERDLVILSDVDEIVCGKFLPEAIKALEQGREKGFSFDQIFCRWFLNRQEQVSWKGSVMTSYGILKKLSPQGLRDQRGSFSVIRNGGWHFSNMGGLAMYIKKLESFSHPEADIPNNKKPEKILSDVRNSLRLVPLDESFPRFVLENKKLFEKKGFFDVGQTAADYAKTQN